MWYERKNFMSKLFNNYILLKSQDCNKFYLFKSGIFYIFLDADARSMSQQFGFKLSNLNNSVVKCGFPTNSLDKYIEKFKIAGCPVHIVCDDDCKPISNSVDLNFFVNNQLFEKTLNNFLDLNIDMVNSCTPAVCLSRTLFSFEISILTGTTFYETEAFPCNTKTVSSLYYA